MAGFTTQSIWMNFSDGMHARQLDEHLILVERYTQSLDPSAFFLSGIGIGFLYNQIVIRSSKSDQYRSLLSSGLEEKVRFTKHLREFRGMAIANSRLERDTPIERDEINESISRIHSIFFTDSSWKQDSAEEHS